MTLGDEALGLLFENARTHHAWQEERVSRGILTSIYDLMKMGPTSTNCCPARYVFVESAQAKARLKDALVPGNVPQTMAAPVTVIMAYDTRFWEKLDTLSPHNHARTWFETPEKEAFALETAKLNATLQHGYFIMAARACGMDCGPMTGFDAAKVDALFFEGTTWKSQILCNVGIGDAKALYPRAARLAIDEACLFL